MGEDYRDLIELTLARNYHETLMDLLTNAFFGHAFVLTNPPKELLIPFNPGGHWVTFHVLIPSAGAITYRYIDSLEGTHKRDALINFILTTASEFF